MQNCCSNCGAETNDSGDVHCRRLLKNEIEKLRSTGRIDAVINLLCTFQFKDKLSEDWKNLSFPENFQPAAPFNVSRDMETTDISPVLRKNGIYNLFHVTHKDNIESIKKYGIIPISEHESYGLKPTYASSTVSRDIEKRHKLDSYIKLAFIPVHPMFHLLPNLALLEIDMDQVFSRKDIMFCRVNSIRNDAELEDIINIGTLEFKILVECIKKQEKDLNYRPPNGSDEWHRCQAEILVPGKIPIEAIKIIKYK